MKLLWAGASASVLIVALIGLRLALMKRVPKGFFAALWWLPFAGLLLPLELPTFQAVVHRTVPVLGRVQASPEGAMRAMPMQSGIRIALEPVAQAMERQAAAAPGIPLWQGVWIAGMGLVLAYGIICTICGYRKFATALPDTSPKVAQWLSAQKLRRPVQVRESDRIEGPMAYGVLRPVILLPKGFAKREDMALYPVLAHELAHIRRLDPLTKLLQWAGLALHWWNPLVWVMVLLWGRDMELACDQRALKENSGQNRAEFAHTLLTLSQGRQRPLATPYALSFSKYALEERIQQMMRPKKMSIAAVLIAVLVALLAVAMAGTAEMKEPNEWLEQAREKIAQTEVVDWSTASEEEPVGIERHEFDGVMMFKPGNRDTWMTYDELVADKEDGYYILTDAESQKYYEDKIAYMEACAASGAHFWMIGKGWMEDPQEALQIAREELKRYLDDILERRELPYRAVQAGYTEADFEGFEVTYPEVEGTEHTKIVMQIGSASYFFLTVERTDAELREFLLDRCTDCVYYGILTQEQANDIMSADFLY